MALLPFISDDAFYAATQNLLDAAKRAAEEVEADPYRNVIDPFSALVDAARQKIPMEGWMQQEKSRQTQKGFQNALGDFHQEVLGEMPGWENLGTGGSIDVKNESKKIIAEVKNKYNTMNSSSQEAVYQKLANHLRYAEKGYTAYVVFIVPKNPRPLDRPWSPNQRTMALRDDIRQMDGQSFYALASSDPGALGKLYHALPGVLGGLMGIDPEVLSESQDFAELFAKAYTASE
jgi:hypothetical protein